MSSGSEQRRALLTGAGGQLAADLAATFEAAGYAVQPRRREELDIADAAAVAAVFQEVRPSVVLNAAAYNRVDDAEKEVDIAFDVNAFGPRVLAQAAASAGATLVHYSTDYVVDGALHRPYREDDAPAPLSAYASSKLCGEYFVRALAPRHYVLRVCGLFGQWGRASRHGNFVETMLRVAAAGRPCASSPIRSSPPPAPRRGLGHAGPARRRRALWTVPLHRRGRGLVVRVRPCNLHALRRRGRPEPDHGAGVRRGERHGRPIRSSTMGSWSPRA